MKTWSCMHCYARHTPTYKGSWTTKLFTTYAPSIWSDTTNLENLKLIHLFRGKIFVTKMFYIILYSKKRQSPTCTGSWYPTAPKMDYNVCPIYIFEINPSIRNWDNCNEMKIDKEWGMDKVILISHPLVEWD